MRQEEKKAGEEKFEVPGAMNQGKKNGPKRARESISNHVRRLLFDEIKCVEKG